MLAVRSTDASLLGLLLGVTFAVPPAAPLARAEELASEGALELHIVYPQAEAEIDPREPAFIAGDAFLRLPPTDGLDAVLVLDLSASVGSFAGADLNGDGRLDRSFAGSDSTLQAERQAAAKVLQDLPVGSTRIALITFSGEDPARPRAGSLRSPAVLEQPLTSDRSLVGLRLEHLARRIPTGMTDMAAALDLAQRTIALAESSGRRDRVVLFFTDGAPTGPHLGTARNLEAALDAAERCRERGIRIHTFAIGADALAHPEAVIRIADLTGGYFTPVENPEDLPDLASQVVRANVRHIAVRNRSNGQPASDLVLDHDGSWSALVPLRPGRNRIEVIATALGDLATRREVVIRARTGAPAPPIPEGLRSNRDAVLRERLARLLQRTEELKDQLRRRLALEVERDRARKELDLEVERPR